jgi:hypothetical protein
LSKFECLGTTATELEPDHFEDIEKGAGFIHLVVCLYDRSKASSKARGRIILKLIFRSYCGI